MGKNNFLLIFFVILTTFSVKAQKGVWYGVSLGVQNTILSSKTRSDIDAKNAFRPISSLDIEYRFNSGFSLQSGLGYALYTQNTSKFKNNFNYLLIPLYLKGGKFKNDNRFALSYYLGFNYKYLLSAKNVYEGETSDISDYTTKSHMDYTLGFGVKYKLQDNLTLESHLTGAYGGNFNNASFDGFVLSNMNYGLSVSLKYKILK